MLLGGVFSLAVGLLATGNARAGGLSEGFEHFLLGLKFAAAAGAGICPRTWPVIEDCREHLVSELKPWIEREYVGFKEAELFDKFKHCTLSCVMGYQCGTFPVLPIGGIKELYDVVDGYIPESIRGTSHDGNPEWADFEADYKGLAASWAPAMRGPEDCPKVCRAFYPLVIPQ